MYLWNTKALASQLKSGSLSQAERFKYFLAVTILDIMLFEILRYLKLAILSITNLIESSTMVLITILGTYWSYTANKTGDDREFIDRYICLSIPLTIRMLAVMLPICFAVILTGYIVFGMQFLAHEELQSWMKVSLKAGALVILYRWMISYIKIVAGKEAD
jgi:hypothetical protein